ncbi:MAG TPA: PAS domain S-box protein, partial [Syntrophorhabdaceae bacterium]
MGDRTEDQLWGEIDALRRRISELEKSEAGGKSAEETSRHQLSVFQTVIDMIPAAIFYKDVEGRYLGCNKPFESLFGISKSDIIGKTAYDLAPPDLAENYSTADAKTLSGPGILRYETSVQDPSGVRHDAIFQKRFFSDLTGKIGGIVGMGIDVTEQKKTEKALREAEDKFRDLAEKSLAGIYVLQDGLIKYANRRFSEIHGYTVEELKSMGTRQTIFPEDLPLVEENLRKRLSGEVDSLHFEFRIITKQQEIRYLEVYGSFTLYEGKPAVIGTLLDITDRKKDEEALQRYREHLEELVKERTVALEKEIHEHEDTERALRESESKFRAIFENATEGISQTTPEGRCLSVNPAFAKTFGYDSPEEFITHVTDIGRQVYANSDDRTRIQRILAEKGVVEGFETEAFRKDGEKIWVSINAHAVRDEHGAVHHYEGTNQDITERKRMEARLKESEERYRTAIEHSNDGVAVARGGRHLYVNQKFLEMFGYDDPGDILGDNTRKDVHPDDRERVLEYSRKRLRGEYAPSRYEFKGIKKDGTTIFVEVSVAVISY